LALLPKVLGIFQKKKSIPPKLVEVFPEKISAQNIEICGFAGGKTLCYFWTLGSPKVHEGGV
jgi:hypothetical protein